MSLFYFVATAYAQGESRKSTCTMECASGCPSFAEIQRVQEQMHAALQKIAPEGLILELEDVQITFFHQLAQPKP